MARTPGGKQRCALVVCDEFIISAHCRRNLSGTKLAHARKGVRWLLLSVVDLASRLEETNVLTLKLQ